MHHLILAFAALTLAACAGTQKPNTLKSLDISNMGEGPRKLMVWDFLSTTEWRLVETCIKKAEPKERAARYQSCYADPVRQAAKSVAFPRMDALETYLKTLEKLSNRRANNEISEESFLYEYAVAKDIFQTGNNVYLQNKYGLFSVNQSAFIKDKDVGVLKKEELKNLIMVSQVGRFIAAVVANNTNGIAVPLQLRTSKSLAQIAKELELSQDQKRWLGEGVVDYYYAMFTQEELRALTKHYAEGVDNSRDDYLILASLKQSEGELMKRKLAETMGVLFSTLNKKLQDAEDPAEALDEMMKEMKQ